MSERTNIVNGLPFQKYSSSINQKNQKIRITGQLYHIEFQSLYDQLKIYIYAKNFLRDVNQTLNPPDSKNGIILI